MHYHFADTGVADMRVLTNRITQSGFLHGRFSKILSISALTATLCLNLCACSTTSETFDCKAGKGVGCKSISEVNHIVNQGGFGESEVEKKQAIPEVRDRGSGSSINSQEAKIISEKIEVPLSESLAAHRIQEEHVRVWIAPFQDEQGNLHEGSVIYTVLKPGYWQLRASPQRAADPRVTDSSVSEARVGDSIISDPTSFGLEEAD